MEWRSPQPWQNTASKLKCLPMTTAQICCMTTCMMTTLMMKMRRKRTPTVMMMMILGTKSRDMFLQCPCTALTSQAKGRGASGDLWWPLSKNLLMGWGNTQLLLTPCGSQFAPFYGPLLERKYPPQNVSILAFFTLPSLYWFFLKKKKKPPPFKLPPHFISAECSQQNTFVCF